MTREEAIAILRQEREDICTDMQCAMTMYRDYSGVDKCNRDCEEREAYDMAIEALKAEPVVRCKECKYWNSKTDLTHCYRLAWVGTEKDDYCSFSERKEP